MKIEDKCEQIKTLLEAELKDIKGCMKKDCEYTSLGGDGCNAYEAYAVLQPIYKKVLEIMKSN